MFNSSIVIVYIFSSILVVVVDVLYLGLSQWLKTLLIKLFLKLVI